MHSMSLFDKQNYSKIKNKQWISAYEVDTTEKPERRSNQRENEQFCLLKTLSYESIGHIDNSDIRIFPWVHIDVGHYFLFFLLGNKNRRKNLQKSILYSETSQFITPFMVNFI